MAADQTLFDAFEARLQQFFQGEAENSGDFDRVGQKSGLSDATGYYGRHVIVRGGDVEAGQLAQYAEGVSANADFFAGFTQRCLGDRWILRVDLSAGEADLPAMTAQVWIAQGQNGVKSVVLRAKQKNHNGCLLWRRITLPPAARRRRHRFPRRGRIEICQRQRLTNVVKSDQASQTCR